MINTLLSAAKVVTKKAAEVGLSTGAQIAIGSGIAYIAGVGSKAAWDHFQERAYQKRRESEGKAK